MFRLFKKLCAFSSYETLADNIQRERERESWRERESGRKLGSSVKEAYTRSNFEETLAINLKKRERRKKGKKRRRENLEYSRIYFAVMWIR